MPNRWTLDLKLLKKMSLNKFHEVGPCPKDIVDRATTPRMPWHDVGKGIFIIN
jgi:hypothetical protein